MILYLIIVFNASELIICDKDFKTIQKAMHQTIIKCKQYLYNICCKNTVHLRQ